jgi:transcriptional regulator with XRE-family HTH domain
MDTPSPPGPPRAFRGPLVRVLREASGLTQDQLAERAGISKGYLSHVERGDRMPRQATIRALAGALGVPVGLLVGRATPLTAIRQALVVADGEPSAVEMADMLGIGLDTYLDIENERVRPTDKQLEVIARRLGVTAELLRDLGEATEGATTE